ncbi:MAG: class I SAM-dependent methyltransferase [Solirubrobacterales bacterium]
MEDVLERRTLAAEDDHWWYRGRRGIVVDSVTRLSNGARPRILDAGCGGGATLAALAPLGDVIGLEPSRASRQRALERPVEVVDGTLEQLPFGEAEFDLALVLDVLEHLADDITGLGELRRVVRPGGALIVTVPAHPRLWSRHDELNHHRRRYTRSTLADAAARSGWRVRRITHFNSLLLPIAVAARQLDQGDGLAIPPRGVNRALEAALQLERLLIRLGVRLPAGLSLLAELRR